jgi:hypothetical protein
VPEPATQIDGSVAFLSTGSSAEFRGAGAESGSGCNIRRRGNQSESDVLVKRTWLMSILAILLAPAVTGAQDAPDWADIQAEAVKTRQSYIRIPFGAEIAEGGEVARIPGPPCLECTWRFPNFGRVDTDRWIRGIKRRAAARGELASNYRLAEP